MRHVIDQAAAWQRSGTRCVIATVVRTWGSAPHGPGASMLVAEDGRVVGSVSGGCVEAAVVAEAEEILSGGPPVVQRWGVGDDDAFAVGLTCGGTIEVLIREVCPEAPLGRVSADLAAGVPVALVTAVDGSGSLAVGGGTVSGSLGDPAVDRAAVLAAEGMLGRGASGPLTVGEGREGGVAGPDCVPERELLVQSFAQRPLLLIFGAAEFARPLAQFGAALGHRVTVCDARPSFADAGRFPGADEVVVDRPDRWFRAHEDLVDEATAVCVLTHDHRYDLPVLTLALRSRAGYVGAMGSRRTHEDRVERLLEAGTTRAELARLRSPIGLDLGGRGPEETALSVLAEIVAVRRGGSGLPLAAGAGPVHRA
ncbi:MULTISPECIES: XdhC family protein [unclassified Streptomyces]|uniref:XdhC family protein n=1 Tax=unclassified Streptomyces TaxID=2593676 RepID=UPI00093A35A1|nr:XdhC/CoxI family protein [Streptomyces sp. CB02058]OKI92498.1 XshC-Cox1 family protein [Streptomyces sp. CB02058]